MIDDGHSVQSTVSMYISCIIRYIGQVEEDNRYVTNILLTSVYIWKVILLERAVYPPK